MPGLRKSVPRIGPFLAGGAVSSSGLLLCQARSSSAGSRDRSDPNGRLADEAEHLFDSFLRDAGVHYSIVRAIASGEQKWSKITNRVGKNSASLSRPLDWLQDMDVITRVIPITEIPPGNPKKTIYRVGDPYLMFWHRFVATIRANRSTSLRWGEMVRCC